MRWRPPVPGQPIEPGPPLVPAEPEPPREPAPPLEPTPPLEPLPPAHPRDPDTASAPDAHPGDLETKPMSDDTAARSHTENATATAAAAAGAGQPGDTERGAPARGGTPVDATTPRSSTATATTADTDTATPPAAPDWFGDPTLFAAFWRYERALMTNDVAELDVLFADGLLTVRSEAGSALVGHDAIAAFRAARPPVPQRYLRRVHLRPIDDNAALIVAESVRGDRGTGSQTQLWQRTDADSPWAVTVAHVSTVPGVQFGEPALTHTEERAIWATPAERRPLVASSAYPGDGAHVGPLAGIRVAVKDLFAIEGETIGAGNPTFSASRAPETDTAPAVQALIDAGAEITGLAQTDELAFSIAGTNVHYGTPPNPAAPGHISGGSTSGPASAVALGLADLGLGTDTAGSIRVPGSYTGLYGLRTTHNAVSRAGLIGLAPSFDTVGLLARDLSTLKRGVEALLATGERMPVAPFSVTAPSAAAPAATDAATPITRILVDPTIVALADADAQLTFQAALRALALNSGAAVQVIDPASAFAAADLERWFEAFRLVQQFEAWIEDAPFVVANPGALDPAIAARFEAASRITVAEADGARAVLIRATAALEVAVPPGAALALPSTSSAAPSLSADPAEIDRVRGATLRLTCLASLSGLPALTLPYGRVGTLPVGLCLLGSRAADLALLALAAPRA
ncbi:MAG: amidase, Asp-tRNAAsn/Glu-tRNAGln amidotransferase subunit [Subtercola sp.]|nr:amidase, Asp-tRNAAsn/Glu-tRNAGln amidotransferase subunit [Subtercola sp.]